MHHIQSILFLLIIHGQSQTINQWRKEIGPTGEDIWRSTSDFIPVQSQSFGTIQLGDVMSVEFDFVWHGRSNDPRTGYYEQFFRVGFDATIADNCWGQGARYPSFWLTNDMDTMHVSVSSGSMCQPSQSLSAYGIISVHVSYHIKIAFNSTQLRVDVSGGGRPHWTKRWTRTATLEAFLGSQVPVWWMSNKFSGSDYNRGNATFSNIVMISKLFTEDPTAIPTVSPITAVPTVSTVHPTSIPTQIPTNTPSVHPTLIPTHIPSWLPTQTPTLLPTNIPSFVPTLLPTFSPTNSPSRIPTNIPTFVPTNLPSMVPTNEPSLAPTHAATFLPTKTPVSFVPTDNPTHIPSTSPMIDITTATATSHKPTPSPVYGSLIECNHNEDCNVICNHPYDCYLSNILCPKTRHQCNIYCTEDACQHIAINAYFNDGGIINIQCNGTNSCFGATIDARHSTNTTLTVQISHTRALSNANIYCADLECVIVTTNGYTSSEGLLHSNIVAQDHTKRLSVVVDGRSVLRNSTIQCPQKQSETDTVCQIMVGNHTHTYTDMLTDAIIRSRGGLNEIELIYDYTNVREAPQVQCGTNYEYACDTERVSIIISNYSQTYWQCQDNIHSDFVCDNTDYIDLICAISGGDIALINKHVESIEAFVVVLDGDTYTYDPWMQHALIKSHLSFEWNCKYQIGTSTSSPWMDCNHMLNGLGEQSVAYAYFNTQTIIENEYYVYQYTLHVTDTTNHKRGCAVTPSLTVSISTIPNEEEAIDIHVPLLVASIQNLDHNYADSPIRLMGKLSTLDGMDVDPYFYKYFWNEISGKLSPSELLAISNSINQKNLIIDSDSLVEGKEYAFQLTVEQYEEDAYDRYIQTVKSQSIAIMVHAPDVSLINSTVVIEDNCILNPIQYATLKDVFHAFFNITFNGQNALQNRYQFGYSITNYMNNEKILLHSSLITSQTYFNHFVLPLSSSIIFHVEILDEYSQSVEINTTEFCITEIENEDHTMNPYACVSYKDDVYNAFKPSDTGSVSQSEQKQLFTVQTSHSVLHLLQTQTMDIIDVECKQQYMSDVLDIWSAEFADLCQSDIVLQLAQVLTNWIRIAVSDSYLSKQWIASTDQIYDLSVQILDPCLSFIHAEENTLEACSDSVITAQSAVCHKGDHSALFLSTLFVTDRYSFIFLSFIESLIQVLDRTLQIQDHFEFSTDLFALIRKSLHIYQLLGLSVSIPYEWSVYDSSTFQLCSYRTLNENVECNGSNIAVLLTANDTKHGKKDLNEIDSDLNGVDVSVIFMQTNKSKALVVDPCSHQNRQNELQGRSATIVLSSDSNTTNLTANVTITFHELDNERVLCVWYDEESGIWDTSGCTTSIDKDNGFVLCSCSHLTTFSTIKYLYNDCLNTDLAPSMRHYPFVSNLIFLILFSLLFCKIISDFVLIFDGACVKRCKKHRNDGALTGPGSVFICTVFELLVCIEFHIAFTFRWDWHKPILIFTLLLPLLSFCWMFFCLLRTWIRIAHSFGAETIIVRRIEKGMVVFMALLVLFVGIEGALVYLQHSYYIYGEIIWCFIMSVFTITYVIYATAAIKTIWISVMAVKNDIINQNEDEDTKLLRKLLIVSILLAVYFLIKTFLSIYLAVNHEYSFVWRIVDMFMQFVSLCIIYCLYGGGIKRLVHKYNNTPIWIKCCRACRRKSSMKPKVSRSIQVTTAHSVEMEQRRKETDPTPYRKESHTLVVSQSQPTIEGSRSKVWQSRRKRNFRNTRRNRAREPGMPRRVRMIHCPSDTDTSTTNTNHLNSSTVQYNQTPTHTASTIRTIRRHKSITSSVTPSLSALPTLSQLESGLDDRYPPKKNSNSDVITITRVHNHPHHQIVHSSSSEGSLFAQFSNVARTRFPSFNMDFDAPLPEQPDHFEESSLKPMPSDPEPSASVGPPGQEVSDDSQQYHE